MAARKKKTRYVSPKGTFLYAWLDKADTKFVEDGEPGDYKVTLAVDEAEGAKFKEKLLQLTEDPALRQALAAQLDRKNQKMPAKPKIKEPGKLETEEDEEGEDIPTGRMLFDFKSKEFFTDRKGTKVERTIPVFDPAGERIFKPVFGGSTGQVGFTVRLWYAKHLGGLGITLDLEAVRVEELVSQGEATASSYGFDTDGEGLGLADEGSPDQGGNDPDDF